MMEVTEYDSVSGAITRVYSFPNADYLRANARSNQIDGAHDAATHYVLDGEPTARPAQTTTLIGTFLVNLPYPCTLYIDSTPYAVTECIVSLEFPLPGTYRLRVEAFPYLDWAAEVTV